MRFLFYIIFVSVTFTLGCVSTRVSPELSNGRLMDSSRLEEKKISLIYGVPVELADVVVPKTIPLTVRESLGIKRFVWGVMGVPVDDVYNCKANEVVSSIFQRVLDVNFRDPDEDMPLIVFGVKIDWCTLNVQDGIAICKVKMAISLSKKDDGKVLFSKSYDDLEPTRSPFIAGKVPDAFYDAIAQGCQRFLSELGNTRYLLTWIADGFPDKPLVKVPTIEKFEYTDELKTRGRCVVSFNDYDSETGDAWVRRVVRKSCCNRFGVTEDDTSIYFNIDESKLTSKRGVYRFTVRKIAVR